MMTNGPKLRSGRILPVDLPRPHTRRALLDHPDDYTLRESLLDFLNDHDQLQGKPCVEH